MSVEAYSYVMTVTRAIPNHIAQAVLSHLADHADRFGRHAFPSVPTLAEAVVCADRTVQRHLRWLEEQGFIRRSRDLSRVSKLPACKRPTVYELSLSKTQRSVFAEEYRLRRLAMRAETGSPADGGVDCDVSRYALVDVDDVADRDASVVAVSPVHEADGGDSRGLESMAPVSPKPSSEPSPLSPKGDIPPQQSGVITSEGWEEPMVPVGESSSASPDVEAFLRRFMQVLAGNRIVAKKPRRSDRSSAERLIGLHGAEESLALARWVAGDGFWCGKMLSVRALERRWEEFRLARRHEVERQSRRTMSERESQRLGMTGSGGAHPLMPRADETCMASKTGRLALVTSMSVTRCPVYGFTEFPAVHGSRTGEAQRHLDGDVPVSDCVVCAYDGRNMPLHGGIRTKDTFRAIRGEGRNLGDGHGR